MAPISPLAPRGFVRTTTILEEIKPPRDLLYPVRQVERKKRRKLRNEVLIGFREQMRVATRDKLEAALAVNDAGDEADHQSEDSSDGAETADLDPVVPPEPDLLPTGDLEDVVLPAPPPPPLRRSTRIRRPVLRYGFS
ncbi:hypothetical protein HDU87_002572 [Geranomyces variabilis]|uniref:Uncharacterized protein n=1 Tax=Geranomyces variabilis TaxID=109894 RepID=A0AAD5TRE1_9FUNG|nr:hypothetical protein HDU87_002572 [Geranomyces variabilis]